jgi:hypothetical protein
MQSAPALSRELLRSLTQQAQVDRRTLVRHISDPPAHPHPAGDRIREALQANGLDHILLVRGGTER